MSVFVLVTAVTASWLDADLGFVADDTNSLRFFATEGIGQLLSRWILSFGASTVKGNANIGHLYGHWQKSAGCKVSMQISGETLPHVKGV